MQTLEDSLVVLRNLAHDPAIMLIGIDEKDL
jgi:hypothetical protein